MLNLRDAVTIGLGAMIGAGVFSAMAPAAAVARSGLPIALALAALVAYCNATSSARLAARYPRAGGTYVYGRERLGPFWGYLAGWCFVVGKTASCAAMALTVGGYAWPERAHLVAVIAVVVLTAVNLFGIEKSLAVTRLLVLVVLVILLVVVVTAAPTLAVRPAAWFAGTGGTWWGVVQGAGLLFFAFAGYARIATLGEEVCDPARTIPRAITLALAITLGAYLLVALAAAGTLGVDALAVTPAYLAQTVREAGYGWLSPVVSVGAVVAAVGSLLSLILAVSRTGLAMARDAYLPRVLSHVDHRRGVPRRLELVIGVMVAGVAATTDLRGAIGFSSFAILLYYAIANVAGATLAPQEGRPPRWVGVVGLAGCLLLTVALPATAVLSGLVVIVAGIGWYLVRAAVPRVPQER